LRNYFRLNPQKTLKLFDTGDFSIVSYLFLAEILTIWPGDSAVVPTKAMAILFALMKKYRFNFKNDDRLKYCDFIDTGFN
jgi:hypothetical protein